MTMIVFFRFQIIKKEKSDIVKNTVHLFKKYGEWYKNPKGPAFNSRQQWQMLLEEYSHKYPIVSDVFIIIIIIIIIGNGDHAILSCFSGNARS